MLEGDVLQQLSELVAFAIGNPLAQDFVNSATNTFFTSAPNSSPSNTASAISDSQEGAARSKPTIRVRTEGGCWPVLPLEWRGYFDRASLDERQSVLEELANGTTRTDYPSSLSTYLATCQRLSLPRHCSTTPILAYPPRPSSSQKSPAAPTSSLPPPRPPPFTKQNGKQTNASRAGQSPKKAHEVDRFGALAGDILRARKAQRQPVTHCIDVGSGRAHLSRALASLPLSLHVLAVDWSASQTSGAEYLDGLKERGPRSTIIAVAEAQLASPTEAEGSLTHRTSALDAEGIEELMKSWPTSSNDEQPGQEAMLVALHACGNLTIDAIKALIADSTRSHRGEDRSRRTAILCGCCYNLQTPSLFPLSSLAGRLPSPFSSSSHSTLAQIRHSLLTRQHLLLTAQSPSTWYSPITPLSFPRPSTLPAGDALRKSLLKLAYRARLEAELEHAGHGSEGERRVGRVGECPGGWSEYRLRALMRYGEEVEELEMEDGERGWEEALWRLQVFWTLRSWLGPVLESLLVLDRWVYLVEGLREAGEWERGGGGRRVELVNLFEQATGSLRNLALVVS